MCKLCHGSLVQGYYIASFIVFFVSDWCVCLSHVLNMADCRRSDKKDQNTDQERTPMNMTVIRKMVFLLLLFFRGGPNSFFPFLCFFFFFFFFFLLSFFSSFFPFFHFFLSCFFFFFFFFFLSFFLSFSFLLSFLLFHPGSQLSSVFFYFF